MSSDLVMQLRSWEPFISSGYEVPAAGRSMLDAAARIEALEGDVAFVKGQLAGTNKNIAGWLQSRDDNLKRAEAAEARAERLRVALEAAKEAADERRGYCEHWEWKYKAHWDEEDAAISKALEDDKQ